MLSGIRKGKKKKRVSSAEESKPSADLQPASDNASIAEQLRRSLAAGKVELPPHQAKSPTAPAASNSAIGSLEKRGRILRDKKDDSALSGNSEDAIIIGAPGLMSDKAEEDMTIQELAAHERSTRLNNMSIDEQMTRNMVRIGKKRRRKANADANEDSDEEIERLTRLLPQHEKEKVREKDVEKQKSRDIHRQIAQHEQQQKITSRCSWWLESSSFSKHRLLALGNHVSLVMAPPNASISQGNHFYLVPLKHSESFSACDDDIWGEVTRFASSLQNVYAAERKSLIMVETVLPNKGFWQTKIEVIPAPFSVVQDSPIFFRSAMSEQTQEWGTHTKIISLTATKPLRSGIPKGFPYFFVGWGNVSTSDNTGYAQIIESAGFSADFGLDTIAAMLEQDPVRFGRKKKYSHEEERRGISEFLSKWNRHDWTTQLDA